MTSVCGDGFTIGPTLRERLSHLQTHLNNGAIARLTHAPDLGYLLAQLTTLTNMLDKVQKATSQSLDAAETMRNMLGPSTDDDHSL